MWEWILISLWGLGVGVAFGGTYYALRKIRKSANPSTRPPISVLKPVKGIDSGLAENLESFFHLRYPHFELIFSIDSETDPAKALIEGLIQRFPDVSAQLVISRRVAGKNPKVNNLVESYAVAKNEIILISDSNVRVDSDYLDEIASCLKEDTGIVTAVVAGTGPEEWGGRLESAYLNTFYARWMYLAQMMGFPTVVGKSMAFRRQTLERLGGIGTLGCYIAEDYMAGRAMVHLGLKVEIMPSPIRQFIGRYDFKNFWLRHLRWGRIRKSHAPLAFIAEPIFMSSVSGALGATAVWQMGNSFWLFWALHMGLWFLADGILMHRVDSLNSKQVIAWWLRELLAFPQWIHTALGNSVQWRGTPLSLAQGGFLGHLRTDEAR